MWFALLLACPADDLPPRNCAERRAFFPDPDGDGFGDRSEIYVGCVAPEGWVPYPEPVDSGFEPDPVLHTGDDHTATAHTGTTGDTATAHTGTTGDTATTADTGP